MKKDGYYSSGQFARMAGVTLRTIRYYDQHDILKPSLVSESGARFYTDTDFARLQQILLLKYLGFSLEDIREMTIEDPDSHFMLNALNVQLKLVQDRIEQMQLVEKTLKDTAQAISEEHTVDWSRMLDLIHLTVMEKSLKNQYQNASNISSRINLHSLYSVNQEGWFPWICQQCQIHEGMNILELGCGDGAPGPRTYQNCQGTYTLPFLIFPRVCSVTPGVPLAEKIPVFLSKLLTVTTFLQGLAPLIWSLPIMYFFTVTTLERCAKM